MNIMNFDNGLILMIVGLGAVLIFLTVMIFSMGIMSKAVKYLNKLFPEVTGEVTTAVKKTAASVDDAIAVAIAAIMAKRS